MKLLHKIARILPILVAVAILSGCASQFLVRNGLTPKYHGQDFQRERDKMELRVPGITAWIDSLTAAGILRDTFVVRDGYRLQAFYAAAPQKSRKTALVVHGYTVNPTNIMMLARMYRDSLGYNVWMPSLRYHGNSGGRAIQMGWFDRLDLLDWSRVAHEHFGDTLQIFQGMSMGAATVMMASGEDTPDYVRGFVEDCGYTCVYDELVHAIRNKAHLPPHPLAENTEKRCEALYGWNFHQASSVEQLPRCSKPMLFIHGEGDTLVPSYMASQCYDAKLDGYREIWIAPGSEHSMSYPDHPLEYLERVRAFLRDHVECP